MESNLDPQPVTLFHAAVETLHPGAGGRTIAKLLDSRVSRHVCLNWRAGRRQAPRWALQILADKIERRAQEQLQLVAETRAQKERPGLSAGALNLARWKANRKP